MTNYYHVLGLDEGASVEEIKAAFKKQAIKYHPDKHPGKPHMEEKFKEVNQAYQVLSDEYEKARYDLKLKYRQFSNTPHQPYSYNRRPKYRPSYTPPRVDYRQNAIATLYAFAITFGIALIVMIGVWIKKGYDRMQLEQLLAGRREIYNEARTSYDKGQYEEAFELMSTLSFFRLDELDMKRFKDNMVDDIVAEGHDHFDQHAYDDAIHLYELVQKFEPKKPFFSLKVQLAEAYKLTNKPDKSIEIYEDLMAREYRIISSLVEIAEIKKELMDDIVSARDYYLTAHQLAVKQYKRFYGEGYSLVIDERYVPSEHYRLYTGLANIYLDMDDPDLAIKAAKWNKYVWPDSVDAYLTSARAFIAKGDEPSACNEFVGARVRGWEGLPTINCN